MSYRNAIYLFIVLIVITSVACKKDKNETLNILKYNQKEIEIGSALGLNLGESPEQGVYKIEVEFFEKSLDLIYTNGVADSLSGKGAILTLIFFTNNQQEISTGVYKRLASGTSFKPNSFSNHSYLIIGYDPANNEDGEEENISGGNVTVSKSGDGYEFTFNLTTDLNNTITGYYKGVLLQYQNK